MKITKLSFSILILVILCGVCLRWYKLTTIPPSLSHDEVAIAYNAYSIWKTGRDEYGVRTPLLFRSFDDYKLPGMVYATIPFVALFGRSEMAARIPSALLGSLSIILMYLLTRELTKKKSALTAVLCTFFFAFQPWHINFSRQLFESNGAVFWFMLGTYFLLKSRIQYRWIFGAGVSYAISLYFYYSVRLVIPFIALIFVISNWSLIWRQWKLSIIALLMSFMVFIPIGREMLTPGGLERISIVSVANDPNYLKKRDEYIQQMAKNPTTLNKIIYNRRIALLYTIVGNYFKNASYHNLFISGTGTYGALYPFEFILVLCGLWTLLFLNPFPKALLLAWLITGFFPGAFSINQPNTLRTLIVAPAFAILSGLGLAYLFELAAQAKSTFYGFSLTALIALSTSLAFVTNFPKFLYAYFVDNPTHNAVAFADGNKQMVEYVTSHEEGYDQIIISGYYWRPYIFMLYWGNIDPRMYQESGTPQKFGKYVFTSAPWDSSGIKLLESDSLPIITAANTLYMLSPQEYEHFKTILSQKNVIDGTRAKNIFIAATPAY